MSRVRDRLTYSNVMSTIGVFLALGGGGVAIAAIAKDSVKSKQIKDGGVKTKDIGNAAVTGEKLAGGAVSSGQLASGSVTGDKLASGSVTGDKLAGGSVGSAQAADNSLTGTDIDESSLQGVSAATVGGLEMKKVNFQVPIGTGVQTVLAYPGIFRIDVQCQNFGDGLDVSAATGVDNSRIQMTALSTDDDATDADGIKTFGGLEDTDFDVSEGFGVDDEFPGLDGAPPLEGESHVRIHYSTPAGFVAVTELALDEDSVDGCALTGFSIGG